MDSRFDILKDGQKLKEVERKVIEFTEKLAVKSGLVNEGTGPKEKESLLTQVLTETNAVYKTHLAASQDPEKVVDLSKHREITNEALIPLRLEGFSKSETRNFLAVVKINQETDRVMKSWGLGSDEFLNMARDYRPYGIRVLYAQHMILKIDEIKSNREKDSQ